MSQSTDPDLALHPAVFPLYYSDDQLSIYSRRLSIPMLVSKLSAERPHWWRVLFSVLAAFFGVQSRRNHEHDFSSGRLWPYLLMAIISGLVFIAGVYMLVQLALSLSET